MSEESGINWISLDEAREKWPPAGDLVLPPDWPGSMESYRRSIEEGLVTGITIIGVDMASDPDHGVRIDVTHHGRYEVYEEPLPRVLLMGGQQYAALLRFAAGEFTEPKRAPTESLAQRAERLRRLANKGRKRTY